MCRKPRGLDTELSALVSESYNRAYTVIVRVQMLAELEELIVYKQSNNNPAKQETMRHTWEKRLLGCQRNVEVWQRMLKAPHWLVISPKENMQMMIKFANLCRKSGRMGLAEKHLKMLIGNEDSLDMMLPGSPRQIEIDKWPRLDSLCDEEHTSSSQLRRSQIPLGGRKTEPALEALRIFTAELADRLDQPI
jgi:FKBP12-rapamycin complex-associated protein